MKTAETANLQQLKAAQLYELIKPIVMKLDCYNPRKDGEYSDFVIGRIEEAFKVSEKTPKVVLVDLPAARYKERSEVSIACFVVKSAIRHDQIPPQDYDNTFNTILYKFARMAQIRNWDLSFVGKAVNRSFHVDFMQYTEALHQ